jgi:hypothetical protein
MKNDPTIKTQEETEEITSVVMSPVEDEWDNIHGDLVLF